MAHILSLAMQKGGVGKTTSTLNLGVSLAKDARVLLVDLDPQANLTMGLGVSPDGLEYTVYEVLLNPQESPNFAIISLENGVDLIPSTLALAGAELELAGKVGRELLLRKALSQVEDTYDYILIDPPPSLGIFTLNALAASDAVIVPLQAHAFSFKAMPQLESTISLVQDLNPDLTIGGIVVTLVDRRTNLSKVVEEQIRERYGDLVFETIIPMNIKLAEAPITSESIERYAPTSDGAIAYGKLAQEVRKRYAKNKEDLARGLASLPPAKPVIKRGQGVQLSTDAQSQNRTNAKSHESDSATNEPKRVNRGYKLREDLIVACKVLAAQRGMKLYEVMEAALSEYLAREETT